MRSRGWDIGFPTHVDDNGDATAGGEDAVLRAERRAESGITIAANPPIENYVSYTTEGCLGC